MPGALYATREDRLSSDQRTRATAKIEVHTYEPETHNLGEGADVTLDYWFE